MKRTGKIFAVTVGITLILIVIIILAGKYVPKGQGVKDKLVEVDLSEGVNNAYGISSASENDVTEYTHKDYGEAFYIRTDDTEVFISLRECYLEYYEMTETNLLCRYDYNRYNVYGLSGEKDEWVKYEERFEIYYDEERDIACGFQYNYDKKTMTGFFADSSIEESMSHHADWRNQNPYAFLANMDPIILVHPNGEYEIEIEYDEHRRLSSYREYDPQNENKISTQIVFSYHEENGTIAERIIYNPHPYSMRLERAETYNDAGNIIYANDLWTSGVKAYYYIYDADEMPAYMLFFDSDCIYIKDPVLLYKVSGYGCRPDTLSIYNGRDKECRTPGQVSEGYLCGEFYWEYKGNYMTTKIHDVILNECGLSEDNYIEEYSGQDKSEKITIYYDKESGSGCCFKNYGNEAVEGMSFVEASGDWRKNEDIMRYIEE